ncbi:dnaJ homolog subfamily C member 25 homolog [Amphibalanus amphitrite]|uniref:dnaJ homolog subfamily C member 25 homolog n=1 Tax=Amphibalanus amphitrite TaxID=1232801 RepID=UPI001C90333C|nr:dnaJ homolog subfamily C member 25 homolog [Amphibalanus amphitrite]XP_043215947.1 dnaJ homolog subfamily C member 25 homolog [Amphibalanus amphitrite]XP_043215948.1 dnaJ homolog subfamily C member 25 homolog [Amphibalanus amphitrite]XP_043215949.1 dnaJ homolog subfamily C member 25 homolog [Amphibalanus amphitrite]XP_043215950.1 dnaJ homolog subfamily C member 25 homolog [Amphibalanus amphitrite]XP_043215951.1 dnaJ homolog subfamily C member 25 homolog [Amphibalanus amphitrite]XP_04321595
MMLFKLITLGLLLALFIQPAWTFIDGLYCGMNNCYDVLGVTRDTPKREIASKYRQLARKTHPDLFKTDEEKEKAAEKFREIATAYEILKDDESRTDYDYMLDNPDEFYSHYYRYYRRRMAPRVDIRIVLAVTISIISGIQYFTSWTRYDSAIRYLVTVPKYRLRAQQIAKEEKLLDHLKRNKKMSKDDARQEEEKILREIVRDRMDIRGGYAKPEWTDVLWVQLVLLPYTLATWVYWYGRWFWKFTLLGHEYGTEEKLYLIRRNMGISRTQFDAMEEHTKEDYLEMELWKKDEFAEWKRQQEEELKLKLANSAQHKQYRRYMKNHGPGRMYFDDS